jgi:hypothetical protein
VSGATARAAPPSLPPGPAAPRRLWPAAKALLILAVVAAVAWQFYRTLRQPGLWEQPVRLRPGVLGAAAVLYLAGLGFSALFWHWLLRALGQRPHFLATLRAYYVGQLGRYVPGKVVGLGVRARLLTGPGVRPGVAVLTVVYESLTTIASGVLVALLVLAFRAPGGPGAGRRAWPLLGVVVLLLLPGVFNWLVQRAARPFRAAGAAPLPRVRGTALLAGLPLTACGWLMQGGALWVLVEGVAPGVWPTPASAWVRCTAYVALAYAAGFLVLAAPGGLGVRDFLLQQFLAADLARVMGPEQAAATAVVVVALLMRLLWTAVDVAAAAACYVLPSGLNRSPDAPA